MVTPVYSVHKSSLLFDTSDELNFVLIIFDVLNVLIKVKQLITESVSMFICL